MCKTSNGATCFCVCVCDIIPKTNVPKQVPIFSETTIKATSTDVLF